ncbi:hypothetical protein [Undibacterium terreum]|uniref:Uncharacterized protein n=1 Tax=Undibacterium terreum TaxID=1224302 RepID=A0A916U2C2_9BURK|nr:hypothetical protein [Undibacterium terreum]GGC58036.1 hypothetical protein GCM10011396_01060 [Undibacterium terreum]
MFVIYWTALVRTPGQTDLVKTPFRKEFDLTCMSELLAFAEQLRVQQRSGPPDEEGAVSHINYCSENPSSIGQAGAADPLPNYDWQKRRKHMPSYKRRR